MENSVSPPKTIFIFLLVFLTILCFQPDHIEAQSGQLLLPKEEVDALKEIGNELGKRDWDFSLNPCDGNSNWNTSDWNSVICDCSSFPAGVCHVTQIFLKGQDLDGIPPPSLAKLPFLKTIDLAENYLSGTIPPEWTLLSNLEYMSVYVNRLSGPIPDYLGNMTKLTFMSLENNMFNGSIPAALGNLTNLETLILRTNNLTGEMPTELSKLTKLTELRLSSNNLTGKLILFDSWTNLQMLEIQGSGFEGPIPSNISLFKNLTELRISDLKGSASPFPSLRNMTSMNNLMLRSCNLSGSISDDIAQMGSLSYLDLSFNNLEGEVPNLQGLQELEIMYLTGNSLSGPVPDWIKNKDAKYQIDLSYNNFTEISQLSICRDTINLYRSFGMKNHSKLSTCLPTCSKDYYEVHINCGGKRTKAGNVFFEADENSAAGNANLFRPAVNWGSSNTGDFWGRNRSPTDYTATNISVLNVNDSALYTTARLSALSLAYYGRCLANGNYTVTLNFAEIIFRDNQSFQSLGKRMFDIYIQDERKLQDFNIENSAGGVDKVAIQQFKAVPVKDGVLEIRFQFAGKGSTAVPNQGTYGPLISAISIKSDFKPPSNVKRKIRIAVSSAASAIFVILIVCIAAWKFYSKNQISREQELRGLDLRTGVFTYKQIRAATDDFSTANKIGEGGFGSVYKGSLLDGNLIAVKRLSQKSKQGNREFVNEIGMISGLEHPNVVKLYGCCIEGNQLLLVYEYLENNSLAQALFGRKEMQLDIDWQTRQRICVGIAKGLSFLHDESALKIVHRDIKGNNILLDRDLNPKISDFGLAKLDEQDNTHITTRVAGTIGYMAPEYALWGYLTYKADVYSFGIVALEIVAGKNNMHYRPSDDYVCLLDWALVLQKRGILVELVDQKLGKNYDIEEAIRMIRIALLCTNPSPALRPKMSDVVSMLEGRMSIHEFISAPRKHDERLNLHILKEKHEEIMPMQSNSSDTEPLVSSSYRIDSSTFSIST